MVPNHVSRGTELPRPRLNQVREWSQNSFGGRCAEEKCAEQTGSENGAESKPERDTPPRTAIP
jgi:hypothetical protein